MGAEDRIVANLAVMRHVHVGHEHVAVADHRHAAAAPCAAVDRDELSKNVAASDDQARLLAPELQVLRNQSDRSKRINLGVIADFSPSVDDGGCSDATMSPEPYVGTDQGVRADGRALAHLCARMDDCGWIDVRSVGNESEKQLALGNQLVADKSRSVRAGQRGASPAQLHFQPQAGPQAPPAAETSHRRFRAGRRERSAGDDPFAAAGSPPPAKALRSSARPASTECRESALEKTPR